MPESPSLMSLALMPRRDKPPIDGIVFDLDGTLVDSRLDFECMRAEMGLAAGTPILEALEQLPHAEAVRCREILARHERAGVERATPLPGVVEFLAYLERHGMRRAIVTRNSRAAAEAMVALLPGTFDPVLTRDDGPVKPDPWPIATICRMWGVPPERVLMVGDFRFDIESGRAAGVRTVYYSAGVMQPAAADHAGADFVLPCFTAAEALWQAIGSA